MDILFISLDFPEWQRARSWSYAANLGFEEGFRANNINFTTIPAFPGMSADTATPASFLGRIRDLCSGRRFDQIWVELVHSPLDADLLDYFSTLAPVRLGLLGESLRYTPDAYVAAPHLRDRSRLVEDRLRYMTHALAVDEQDVEDCNRRKMVKAMWWVSAVPERFINKQSGPLPTNPATFSGAVYGVRSDWLEHPALESVLERPAPLEDATPYPGLFNKLNSATFNALQGGKVSTQAILEDYLPRLRHIRQECFSLWLDGLRSGCAVVNLQSFLQAYAGRVVEGMAAGRPVITWAIPERPRNSALFKDGEEILMFPKDEPEILAQHIMQLRIDRKFAERIVLNARQRVLRFHTTEKRVGQILEWIETGCEPAYNDGGDNEILHQHAADVALAGPQETELNRRPDEIDLSLKEGTPETALNVLGKRGEKYPENHEFHSRLVSHLVKMGNNAKVAGHLRKALRVHPNDPELWLEVMRLAVINNDRKTAESAMDSVMDLCPDRKDILAALQNISANGIGGIDQVKDLLKENLYYENLFLNDPSWSSPSPNLDEEARWGKIKTYLKAITNSHIKYEASNPRILDLGCGRGWLSNLASRYGHVEGIDPVREVIKGARRHFPHVQFFHGTARTILDKPDFIPYDLILSSEVIEHVPNSEKEEFVTDLFELLKPGGRVILTTPRGEAYDAWKKRTNFVDQPVEEWLTEGELVRLFETKGFRPVGSDRIYVDLRTFAYSLLPESHLRDSAVYLGLYQVWVFQRQGTDCREMQRSWGCASDMTTAGKGGCNWSAGKTGAATEEGARHVGESPLVSVIVPTYNRPEMLRTALKSILAQTLKDFEIIVVNDAGEDVTGIVASLGAEDRITVIRHDRNHGLAAARNTGIRRARGKYIAYLDDDDRYLPDHLETLVRHLETSGDKVAYSDAARVFFQKQADGPYLETGKDFPYSRDFDPRGLLVENFIPVLCVIHEKSCLAESGLFDETLKRHEDWDLWIRLSFKNRFGHVRKVTSEFTCRDDGSGMMTGTLPMFLESYLRIYGKYGGSAGEDPDLEEKRKENLNRFRKELYNFIHQKISSILMASTDTGSVPENAVMVAFDGTGARSEHILAGFQYILGFFYRNSGEKEQAIACYRRALNHDPEHPFALSDLLELVAEKGNPEEEKKVLDLMVSANPRDVEAARRLSDLYRRLGNREKELRIVVYTEDRLEHACARLRLVAPLSGLKGKVETLWGVSPGEESCKINEGILARADLVILQRFFPNDQSWPFVDRLLRSGIPVIYEVDDLLTALPENNPHRDFATRCAPFIEKVMRSCTAITVSTRELGDRLVFHNPSIHVLPNLLEEDLWMPAAGERKGTDDLVVGYTGTPTHQADLEHVEQALEVVADRYRGKVGFLFFGCATERMKRLPGASFLGFRPSYREYAEALRGAKIDIAIAPLADNRFNRCKSNIKWLEYSACGIAGVYQDLPPYNASVSHGRTGLLAGSRAQDWVDALDRLIRCPQERARIAGEARTEVLEKHTLSAAGSRYLDAYREIMERHARAGGKRVGKPFPTEQAAGAAPSPAGGNEPGDAAATSDAPDSSGTASGGSTAGNGRREYSASIVIPLFNKVEYTGKCVEALVQTVDPGESVEIVLVDNGSTDDTAAFLSSLGGDVVIVRNTKNLGFAMACNQGARVSRGRNIVFLNNDTVPQPGWLQALLSSSREEDAAICGARLVYPDGRIQHAGVAFSEKGIGYHIFNGFPGDHPAVMKRRRFQAVTAACMLVRRDVFESLGGFDEEYRNGFEDVDFCLRAGEKGCRILYAPESVVVHHEETTDGRKAHDRENMERFLARWRGKVVPDDDRLYTEEGFRKIVSPDGGRITIEPVEEHRPDAEDPSSRGRALKKEKRYVEAIEAFRQARSRGDLSILADIGDCLAQEGNLEEAASAYREAVTANPRDPRALAGLGVLDLVAGNPAGAAERFTSVLETDGRDATALCGMGMTRKACGKAGEAFDWFMRALDADPVNATALHELVKTAHELGRLEEAERYLSTYLQYKPSDPHILFSLAGILVKSGKRDEALDTLERLVFFEPSYGGASELRERIASSTEAV